MKWMCVVLVSVSIVVCSLLIVDPVSSAAAPPITVGGLFLGQTLGDFQSQFPLAHCGSPSYMSEVLHAGDHDNFNLMGCCVDDPQELAQFSQNTMFIGGCHVLATFDNFRLIKLRYVLSVSNLDEILPEYKKAHGLPTFDETRPKTNPRRIVAWVRGKDLLDLAASTLQNPKKEVVIVHLWKIKKN